MSADVIRKGEFQSGRGTAVLRLGELYNDGRTQTLFHSPFELVTREVGGHNRRSLATIPTVVSVGPLDEHLHLCYWELPTSRWDQ